MVVDSWYNGYSPKERDDKYKELKKLIANGSLTSAIGPCDLCNDPNVPVEHHDEDYGLPYLWEKPALFSLCRSCHRHRLHKRFNNPSNWYTFLAHVRRGGYASDLKDKLIMKELNNYKKTIESNDTVQLKKIRDYKYVVGNEWFANLRMDIESLNDKKARPRG